MRSLLDRLYQAGGALAALFITLICLLVAAQVTLNLITRIFGTAYSYTIPSYADFAGFFLAAASFLALAYTLRRGGHIRVTLVLRALPPSLRLASEIFSLSVGATLAGTATWFMARLNLESYSYGDLSFGIVAIPIWIPQLAVTGGLALLTVAFLDLLVGTLRNGAPLPDADGKT